MGLRLDVRPYLLARVATENALKACQLRDHARDNERGRATGNQAKARQACEQWTQTYPVIDEAHEIFAALHKRYEREGIYDETRPAPGGLRLSLWYGTRLGSQLCARTDRSAI
jgi:hypothetical protein